MDSRSLADADFRTLPGQWRIFHGVRIPCILGHGCTANLPWDYSVSWEKDLASGHDIHKNGYNIGRDWLVGNLTSAGSKITTMNLTNTSTYSGESLYGNYTYKTNVQYVSGLMANTSGESRHDRKRGDEADHQVRSSVGINHNIT